MRAVITVLCISALSASAVGAQTSATIDPGMTRDGNEEAPIEPGARWNMDP